MPPTAFREVPSVTWSARAKSLLPGRPTRRRSATAPGACLMVILLPLTLARSFCCADPGGPAGLHSTDTRQMQPDAIVLS